MREPLRVADPHIHLWDLSTGLYPHFEAPATSFVGWNGPIARSYLLPELLAEGRGAVEVEALVHVEAIPTDPLAETRHLDALAEGEGRGFPQALVAAADLAAEDAERRLEEQAAFARVRGVRQILNRHPDPFYSYGADDHMANPAWRRAFGRLARLGLSFDLQIYPYQMEEAARLAADNPEVAIVLNHAGMPVDRTPEGWRTWKGGLRRLSERPNVAVKVSGLGMFDHDWTVESLRPYVLETLEAFGPGRAMFASNFPVDKLFAPYAAHWRAFAAIAAAFSDDEREALFRGTARRVYRLEGA